MKKREYPQTVSFPPSVLDSKVDANEVRHFSSLCFVLGI